MLEIIILAAGKGTRMYSDTPKVLHKLAGQPFLGHVLKCAKALDPDAVHTVIGHGSQAVRDMFADGQTSFVEQTEQLGTGHAVMQALPAISNGATVLILYGDVPLIKAKTLQQLIGLVNEQTIALLTVHLDEPSGYGRIVRNADAAVSAIVEQKDANAEQLMIHEVNTGVLALPAAYLARALPQIKNENTQGEYYLTDLIAMAVADGLAVNTCQPSSEHEVAGVNNRRQQAELERIYQLEFADELLDRGVSLLDPSRFDCRGELIAGKDCEIDINCVFEGRVELGDGVKIGPNCLLTNAKIGDNTVVKANSIIETADVGAHCDIGPFARLRPGTELANKAKIGNFVETKKAKIGEGSKVNHLSYVGDALVGKGVNIGAGTITCNYDGANKHQTNIQDDVFVGSNTALVAPLTIGKGATIGAGATITGNVEPGNLAIARAKQRGIAGWLRPTKTKK